ncbi:MAG: hypothetical protein ACD_63C00185G0004 [uncultured bacterium]|nr:MAG: hypothetical protein ACD_63C00185G0004 [uncultured bacterium]
MNKRFLTILLSITAIILTACFVVPAIAQEIEKPAPEGTEELPKRLLEAVAGEDQNVPVGSKVIFDGSKSVNSKDGELKYTWDFGDGTIVEGVNELHIYNEPGTYKVLLTVNNGEEQNTDELIVSVYENLVILITDKTPDEEKLREIEHFAAREGVLIIRIQDLSGQPDYIAVEEFAKKLAEEKTNLQKSGIIIDWTSGSVGLNALTKFAQKAEKIEELDFTHKVIVSITNKPSVTSRIAQQTFDILKPEYILLTGDSALHPIITAKTSENVLKEVRTSFIDYKLIGIHSERSIKKLGWTNFLSYAINFMVNKGVPINTILLILMIPVIATIVAFARQVIGIKAFGIYIPSIITLALLVTGIKYGLAIFIIVLVVATLIRFLMKYLKILYLPRMAIMLTVLAFTILAMFAFGAMTMRTGFIAISIFPIIIITILAEEFVKAQIEKGLSSAIQLAIETLIISVLCYYLVSWEDLRTFFLSYPETILLTLAINYFLGKWTGLRVFEYFRFKELRKKHRA